MKQIIESVRICRSTLSSTRLASPAIVKSFRDGLAVTADVHLTSWHAVDTTHPQLSSPGTDSPGTEMKEYWRFLSGCDRIQGVWRIDAAEESWLGDPSVSVAIIFSLTVSLGILIKQSHFHNVITLLFYLVSHYVLVKLRYEGKKRFFLWSITEDQPNIFAHCVITKKRSGKKSSFF